MFWLAWNSSTDFMNSCLQFKISKSFKQQLQQIPIQLSSKNGLSTVLLLLGKAGSWLPSLHASYLVNIQNSLVELTSSPLLIVFLFTSYIIDEPEVHHWNFPHFLLKILHIFTGWNDTRTSLVHLPSIQQVFCYFKSKCYLGLCYWMFTSAGKILGHQMYRWNTHSWCISLHSWSQCEALFRLARC